MKAVLISIQPKWCEKIASGEKTIEVRKSVPKLERPFKVYIYCTKENKHYDLYINESKAREEYGVISRLRAGQEKVVETVYGFNTFIANGKVIGEFVCDEIEPFTEYDLLYDGHYVEKTTRVSQKELLDYKGKNDFLFGWHISQLKIYDKPKELGEFKNLKGKPIQRAFQSWGYCYEKEN